jgi:ABC-type transport system involved in multi-copper enzyme maturation permease subunit
MLERIFTIALNALRENVRARLLHGLFALALLTAGYSLVVGAYSFRDTVRVIGNLGGASVSLYSIVVAVVLGATSLYRELELKTCFPILARPIARWEYLVGKSIGAWLTLLAFVAVDTGALLLSVGVVAGRPVLTVAAGAIAMLAFTIVLAWRFKPVRNYAPILLGLLWVAFGAWASRIAPDERNVLIGTAALSLGEVAIVIAVANVFAAFSTPFLSAMLTIGVVVVGRSADVLMRLPARVFGKGLTTMASILSKLVPNLMLYVPSRSLMTGEIPGADFSLYVLKALGMATGWAALLTLIAALIFRRRDFT